MPKLKTNSGAKKRFKRDGKGRLKRRKAYRNHILTKKAKKRKRHLRKVGSVSKGDARSVNEMLRT